MRSFSAKLVLPPQFVKETNSALELASDLQRLKRPVDDISFKDASYQRSRITGIKVDGLTLHEVQADAAVTKSTLDPRPSFILPFSTGATIVSKRRSICIPATTHVSVVAWHRQGELHSGPPHLLGIQPNIDELIQIVSSMTGKPHLSTEAFFHEQTAQYCGCVGNIDYIAQLLSLVDVVNGTRGDISLINRIGVSDVITKVLAELT